MVWAPIAAMLALALWAVLSDAFEPWTRPTALTGAVDDLPPQLVFAAALLLAGRFETARWRGDHQRRTSIRTYWMLLILAVVVGAAALGSIPRFEAQ